MLLKGLFEPFRDDFCENAVLAYGDTIWTVQPHPEYGPDFIDGLIETRGRGVVPEDRLEAAKSRLDGPLDSGWIADQMADVFLKADTARGKKIA